ncbi:nucleotide-sugar epimerase [Baekduia alba]|uniref:SDR family oxidoreductase n=1 Tax=Baekduia alba TaxID=2997333 RepID=UPI00234032FB|nr:sugar nucleotide-binding protein [Baekduia alba]WCB94633.1 nucleotide-sugar epimerase [Baekduia alba]
MRRVWVTGASGFVGSNIAYVLAARHGVEVIAPTHADVDLTDGALVARSAAATRPDAIVHAAILNDFLELTARRRDAWEAFVGATRNVVDAANAADVPVVLISTDWVFDGTSPPAPAAEDEPPNPINMYGFLKAASELVVSQRARRGVIARVAGVQGVHRARVGGGRVARVQDAGFGYLVASMVEALRAGRPFTVWDGPGLNALATPTLATDAGELIWRALEREVTGVLHCVGGEHADRVALARRAVKAYDLDPDLLLTGPPPDGAIPPGIAIPRDTRLDATRTAALLDADLPDLDMTLARLGAELDTAWSTTA